MMSSRSMTAPTGLPGLITTIGGKKERENQIKIEIKNEKQKMKVK